MNLFELAIVVSAVDKATSVLNGVKSAITGAAAAGEKMKQWGQQASIGGALMTGASQQIIGGLQGIVEPANAVEDSLMKVRSVLTPLNGDMGAALKSMQGAAIDWSKTHTDSASKFLDTTYMMISAGLDQTASIEATRTAMLVAKATIGESTQAAALLGTAYNNMADKSKPAALELGRLGDVVTKTQQNFAFANMDQLAQGLEATMGSAIATKLSFEQLNTVIGLLNNRGIKGAEAGTVLSMTLSKMASASKAVGFSMATASDGGLDLIGTIKNIETQFGTLSTMSEATKEKLKTAFGEEVWNKFQVLIGQSKELTDGLAKVKDSAGAAATAAALMGSTGSANIAIAANQMTALKVAITDQLRPSLMAIAGVAAVAITALIGFVQAHPGLTKTAGIMAMILAGVLGIVGPILLSVGAIGMFAGHVLSGWALLSKFGMGLLSLIPSFGAATASAWAFTAALLANPITWIVLAIVAAAGLVYLYWEPIKAFFIKLWTSIKAAFIAPWMAIVGVFTGAFDNIKAAFKEGLIKGIITVFTYLNPILLLTRIFIAVAPWLFATGLRILRALGDGVAAGFNAMVGWVSGIAATVWDAIKAQFDQGFLHVLFILAKWSPAGVVVQALYYLGAAVVNCFTWIGGIVGGLASSVWNAINGAFDNGIMNVLLTLAKWSPVGVIAQALNAVVQMLTGFSLFDAGSKILNSLTAGIKAAAAGPVNAVMGVVQKVRNLLPFSPAKDGPLRDLHRVRLIETIAQTVRAAPLVSAMSGAAALAIAAVPSAINTQSSSLTMPAMPSVMPLPAAGGRQASSETSGQAPLTANFYISGGADASTVALLDKWLKDNQKKVYDVVKRQTDLDKRSDFT